MKWIVLGSAVSFALLWGLLTWKSKWILSRPPWQRMAATLVAVGALFALIGYMNHEARKNEAAWDKANPVLWVQLPVRIHLSPSINPAVLLATLDLWENGTCDLFEFVEPGEPFDVVVERGAVGTTNPETGRPLAGGTWRHEGIVRVVLYEPGNPTHEYLVVAHEFTHVLGLAHDYDPRFITTEGAQKHTDLSKRLPFVSEKDRAAIKERYCN